jgi:uncharacterized protein YkwD
MRLVAATLAFAAACGLAIFSPAAATAAAPTLDSEEQALRTQINAYRAAHGLRALRISAPLTRAAEWMSRDMVTHDYFDHIDSRGRDYMRRILAFGFRGTKGENLAGGSGDAAATFEMLKSSAAHRRNMLRPTLKVIGIARAYGEATMLGWYWTTTFGAGRARAAA